MSIVWLFKEHRDLYDAHMQARLTINDLEQQLKLKSVPSMAEFAQAAEELFQDRPYPKGRIPDDAWLSPGENDRPER